MSQILFIGTYSEPIRFGSGRVLQGGGHGIHTLRLDHDGTLTEIAPPMATPNPSFLAFDPRRYFLYAVNELKEFDGRFGGSASAYAVDDETGELTYLNTVATHGTDPCHLAVDRSGRHVLVANYSSGHTTVLPIQRDGSLGEAIQVIAHSGSGVDPQRQAGPHCHHVAIDTGGTHVFVSDLGADRVVAYRLDPKTGKLSADHPPFIDAVPGGGPRQTILEPGLASAFVLNELGSSVTHHAYDEKSGRLTPKRTVSTLPAGFAAKNLCAELQVAPTGRFLYASNRGHDSIAIFALAPDGDLTPMGQVPTGGGSPRCFDLSPSGDFLVVANQDSGTVVPFRVDAKSGALTPTGGDAKVGTPVCVRFL